MEELPQAKGMKPVSGITMLNFLYWLQTNHPNTKNLQSLSQPTLLQLVKEFEGSRPDIEPSPLNEWAKGINRLHAKASDGDYTEARAFYHRMQ